MSDDPLKPGGALAGRLFEGFLRKLADTREPAIGERIGPFVIRAEIGRGGSSVVFMAERADGAFTQQVALKWLRGDRPVPGGSETLARERELLASLDHPNIARLVDGGESDDGQLWFAMDYVAGRPIDEAASALGLPQRLSLLLELCQAVHHAHSRGLIHGDIKPANVLIDERGRVRLLDFGIARLQDAAMGGSYGLTPEFASPEQRAGEPLTTASDVWQLGHLLQVLCDDARLPDDLRAIIERAVAESPDERYASAAAMAADIEAGLSGRPVVAHGGGWPYRCRRWVGRNQAASSITGLAVILILGSGLWMAWQVAEERDQAQRQAALAESALIEAEAALARSERLHDFLISMFQASRPLRPRDQLPSTAQILDQGARQALEPDIAPAAERFGMLSVIGQVYQAQSRYELARPLIEEAARLARDDHNPLRPADRARALASLADLMVRAGDDLDQAEALLLEAERLLERPDLNDLVPMRITRVWIERHRGQHGRALRLIEPLAKRMNDGEVMSASRRALLLDGLASLQAATGQLEQASATRTRATEAMLRAQGEEGQGHVVSLANSVGLELALGHFDEAEQRARRAIALYDRIYPEPVDYRAAVRSSLARVLLTTGRTEEALAEQALAGAEQARALGYEPERWPLTFSLRATFHVRLGQLDRAAADMQKAHDLLTEHGELGPRLSDTMDMLLAWVQCLHGNGNAGVALLDGLDPNESLFGNARNQAQWHEAQAACRLALNQHGQALLAIDQALDLTRSPGQLLARIDRQLLKARILSSQGHQAQAKALLTQSREELQALGLVDHPVLDRLRP